MFPLPLFTLQDSTVDANCEDINVVDDDDIVEQKD